MDERTKWFRRLKRVLRDMPIDAEIQIHNNHIQLNERGARDAAFARDGDGDNADSLESFDTAAMRVYSCGESV